MTEEDIYAREKSIILWYLRCHMLCASVFLHNTAFLTPTRKRQSAETAPSSTVKIMTLQSPVKARSTAQEVLVPSCLRDFKSAPGYSGANTARSLVMGPKSSGKSNLGPFANPFDCRVEALMGF